MKVIELDHATLVVGDRRILVDTSFAIEQGEFIGLLRLERRPGTKNSKPERAGSKSYRVFSRLERTILGRPECSSQSVSR